MRLWRDRDFLMFWTGQLRVVRTIARPDGALST
jgi:hypothetical protein